MTLIVLQLVSVDNEVTKTDTGSKIANVGRDDGRATNPASFFTCVGQVPLF
jgi:hypothetical protein